MFPRKMPAALHQPSRFFYSGHKRVPVTDWNFHLCEHISSIKTFRDQVQVAPTFSARPTKHENSAPFPCIAQQRLVQIPTSEPGNGFPDCLPNVMAEVRGDDQIGLPRSKLGKTFRVVDIERHELLDAVLFRQLVGSDGFRLPWKYFRSLM